MTKQKTWRFIPLLEASGSVQMAIERWLLQQHLEGKHPPTLRFYTWSPVAISLGYHQRHYPSFWNDISWEGKNVEIVRRPTGGRAVLHQGDLTYMIVASDFMGKRAEVYKRICQFLLSGWRSLGIELSYGEAGRGYIQQANCFGTATNADLIDAHGKKLIGSAQLRQGNAILQHGSMQLFPSPRLFQQVFAAPPPTSIKMPPQLTQDNWIATAISVLTEAAEQSFGIELVQQPLEKSEWQAITDFLQKSGNKQ